MVLEPYTPGLVSALLSGQSPPSKPTASKKTKNKRKRAKEVAAQAPVVKKDKAKGKPKKKAKKRKKASPTPPLPSPSSESEDSEEEEEDEQESAKEAEGSSSSGGEESEDSNDEDPPPATKAETPATKKTPQKKEENEPKKKRMSLEERQTEMLEKLKSRPVDAAKESRTLFVGNLPKSITMKQLKRMFKECGKVESARFRSFSIENPYVERKDAVRRKMARKGAKDGLNGYVVFESEDAVEIALAFNGHNIGSDDKPRVIRVDRAKKTVDHSRSIFVGNLAFVAREDELRKAFGDVGEIANVRIIRDPLTQIGKGFGFVVFKDQASVNKALNNTRPVIRNRKLRVTKSYDNPSAPRKKKRKLNEAQIEDRTKKRTKRVKRAKLQSAKRREKLGFPVAVAKDAESEKPVRGAMKVKKSHKGRDAQGNKLRWRKGLKPKPDGGGGGFSSLREVQKNKSLKSARNSQKSEGKGARPGIRKRSEGKSNEAGKRRKPNSNNRSKKFHDTRKPKDRKEADLRFKKTGTPDGKKISFKESMQRTTSAMLGAEKEKDGYARRLEKKKISGAARRKKKKKS